MGVNFRYGKSRLYVQYEWNAILIAKKTSHSSSFWNRGQSNSKILRIFADVIVYIFPHYHTTYLTEAVAVMTKLKDLIKLSDFQLFASGIEGNNSHQKLRNCWVAKKFMSHTSPVKFRVFRRKFLRNHSMFWTQIFREN